MREKLLPKLTVSEGGQRVFETHTEVQRCLKEGMLELACGLGRKPSEAKEENITLTDVMRGYLGNTKQDGYIWVRIRNCAVVTPSPTILLSVHLKATSMLWETLCVFYG